MSGGSLFHSEITSIIKGLFPLIVIPKWEDKCITRLASSKFGMDWRCENKLRWEVRWCIVVETFKNNYIDPTGLRLFGGRGGGEMIAFTWFGPFSTVLNMEISPF